MRYLLTILFSFSFISTLLSTPLQDRRLEKAALLELAKKLQIPEDEDLMIGTQKKWLRNHGQERWEMEQTLSPEDRAFVVDWAQKKGLYSPWTPCKTTYDKALILGATTSCMQKRLDYLTTLWEEGVRFDKIVWLTGKRPLDAKIDGLLDSCKNESEAARVIWEKASLPEEMRKIPILFIEVEMKKEGNNLKRPNTQDTIIAFLEVEPEPCRALFVSDQPFCGYQDAIIAGSLSQDFLFDTVGPGVDPSSHPLAAVITLDSISRWIYQDELNNKKK
ncbi:MAG TPA: hypothetical protein VJK48_05435 [Chlamydiales bacterium]|nr:hypothetical protein [Chlamydiales bacterium]